VTVAYQDSEKAVITTGTLGTVTKPTITDGSTVLYAVFSRGSNSVTTPPAGFNEILDAGGQTGTTGSAVRAWVFRKYVAVASGEPATYAAQMGAAINGCAIAVSLTGADITDPIQVASFLIDAVNNATVISPDVTAIGDGLCVRFAAMNTNDGIASWATGDANEVEDVAQAAATNRVGAAAAWDTQVGPGAVGAVSWTVTLVGGSVNYGAAAGITIVVGGALVHANAGANQTVDPGELVTLSGSGSTGVITSRSWDADPGNPFDVEPYWIGETTATATFIAPGNPSPGPWSFTFTHEVVGAENTDSDDIVVTVSEPTEGGASLAVQVLNAAGDAV